MYFRRYRLRKKWLDKWLISPVLEGPLTGNVVNEPKHCLNLNCSTFTKFIDHVEGN